MVKKNILFISLTALSLTASQMPPSSPHLRNSTHLAQEQEIDTNSPRVRLSLLERMKIINPSLNLDANKLLAPANNIPNTNNHSPK